MANDNKLKVQERCPTCQRPYMLPDHVEHVLREAGREMSLGDIAFSLERKGVLPIGKAANQPQTHNALKRNPKRFKKVGRGLYELR